MASLTSSMLVNDNPYEEVHLPQAGYVCCGGCSTWDNERSLRQHSTDMLVRGTACEDEESSAVRRNMLSVHLATGQLEFRPIFQPGTWSPWAAAIYSLFMKLGS